MSTLAQYLITHRISPIAIFYIQDECGKGLEEALRKKVGNKIRIVYRESMKSGQTDFRTQLTKVKALKITNIVILEYGGVPTVSLMKQAKETIQNVKFFGELGMLNVPVRKLSPEITNGTVLSVPAIGAGIFTARGKDFARRYQAKFNSLPGQSECFAYDAITVLAKAIKQARSIEPMQIKNNMLKIRNFEGVSGPISYLKNGDLLTKFIMATYKEGKVVPLYRY
jgi:branched-chain amino acid transport system substrate-binding protein